MDGRTGIHEYVTGWKSNYLDALARSYSLSDGPRFDTGNSLRRQSQPPLSSLHSVQEQPSKVV